MAVTMTPASVQPAGANQALIYQVQVGTGGFPAFANPENANEGGAPAAIMRFCTSFSPANGSTVADLCMWGGDNTKQNWTLVLYTVTGGVLS